MTQFKGTPLFGKESSPSRTSSIISAIVTVIFWLLFGICSIFIKVPEKKPKFKDVQIVLSSTPVEKKVTESPAPAAPAPAPSAVTEEVAPPAPVSTPEPVTKAEAPKAPTPKTEPKPAPKPAAPKAEPKPAPKAESKPAPKKEAPKTPTPKPAAAPAPTPTPAPAEPVEYAVDPMEAFNQQVATKPKKSFNWDDFGDDSAESSSSTATPQKVQTQPVESSFSGSAASAAETTTSQRQSSTTATKKQTTTSSATSNALGKIANTTYNGRAVAGISSEVSVKAAASGSGKVLMEMADGTSRALLSPAEPVINLSEKAAQSIDGSRTVTISFRIVESGNVPRGEISISPASTLSDLVKKEILDQICTWLFEAASYDSNAKFEYKIVKK